MMRNQLIRGNKWYYEDLNSSNKEVILLIHGHPFDHSMWKYQYEALENFRLILPDLRGYGKSDYEFDKIYIEEQALDLAIFLDELNIEKVHLIGLSMGGQIAVEFTMLFKDRVKSMVLCDTNPVNENSTSYQNRLKLAEKITSIGMKEYTEQSIHEYLHPKTPEQNKEVFQHLYQMMENTQTKGAVASHKGRAERRNNEPFLSKITVPTLVIVGDEDFFTPVAEMKNIADKIPNAVFEIIENAGHMPNMEQPKIFNEALIKFYNKL